MTPQTRALIEAAEEMFSSRFGSDPSKHVEAMLNLRAAIASAKAAEEGVETTWFVKGRSQKNRQFDPTVECRTKEDAEGYADQFISWYGTIEAQVLKKDTYTTVISVREKEGLDD